MRLPALILLVLPAFLPAGAAAQTTLNKCIDAEGRVTYSNLPCRGAREVKRVEIDPPPPPPKPAPTRPALQPPAVTVSPPVPSAPSPGTSLPEAPPATPPAAPMPTPAANPVPPPPIATPLPAAAPPRAAPPYPVPSPVPPRTESPMPAKRVAPRSCDTLTDQLGRVLDRMDAAQRQGVSPQQMETWRQEIQELERRKTEAGCF